MKLLFLNGSRGEWGYIRPIIQKCEKRGIEYGICATNMLLLHSHGGLIEEIRRDGFNVCDEIFMSLEGHNHFSMTKSLGIFLNSFTETLRREKPDWVILAGDRGEQLMGAIAASYTYTAVAHIQAGERSGNIDGVARHAIGKFVHVHFAANDDAANRLLRLGEEAFRIHNIGAPQLDELYNSDVPEFEVVASKNNLPFNQPFILVVQHPVTEEYDQAEAQVLELIEALNQFDFPKFWILPNNDAGASFIRDAILNNRRSDYHVFDNLTRFDYLSLLKNCQFIIGNSSSGILEAPTYKTPAINLGSRQDNRIQACNVINSPYKSKAIITAINKVFSQAFCGQLEGCTNPYGDGNSSESILDILQSIKLDDSLLIKKITF